MARRPARVVFLGAPGTFARAARAVVAAGHRADRLVMVTQRPVPPSEWLGVLRSFGRVDDVVVTSRAGVVHGVIPWRTGRKVGRRVRFWPAGPSTAAALRAGRVGGVRSPDGLGASALIRAIGGGRRRIVRFRSDRAGGSLARALRAGGHRVADVVVYRTVLRGALGPRARSLLSRADLLVASSPSAIRALALALPPVTVRRLGARTPIVVIGQRSARAARAAGFVSVSVAPSLAAQRFTLALLPRNHA